MNNVEFLKEAINLAEESYNSGAFPAGTVIVRNGEIVAKSISAKYPEIIFHAESNAIDQAMNKAHNQLSEYIMYSSMQPCLMCMSRAYWAGIRKIYYAIKKEHTDKHNYESDSNYEELLKSFNEPIEMIQIQELEDDALKIVNKWESENYK